MTDEPMPVVVDANMNTPQAFNGVECAVGGYGLQIITKAQGVWVAFGKRSNPRYRVTETDFIRPGGYFSRFFVFLPDQSSGYNFRLRFVVTQTPDAVFYRPNGLYLPTGAVSGEYTSAVGQQWRAQLCNIRSSTDESKNRNALLLNRVHVTLRTPGSRVLMRVSRGHAYTAIPGATIRPVSWEGGTSEDRVEAQLEYGVDGAESSLASNALVAWWFWLDTNSGQGCYELNFARTRSEKNEFNGQSIGTQGAVQINALTVGAFTIDCTCEVTGLYY